MLAAIAAFTVFAAEPPKKRPDVAQQQGSGQNIANVDGAVNLSTTGTAPLASISPSGPLVSLPNKLRVKDAKLRTQTNFTAVLQSAAYSEWMAAVTLQTEIVAEVEKQSGCKIDANAECLPEPKPVKPAAEQKPKEE